MAQDLSEMLGQMLENPGLAQMLAKPEFAAMVQNLRQGMGDTPDVGALMEKLPAMMAMLSGRNGTAGAQNGTKTTNVLTPGTEEMGANSATVSATEGDGREETPGAEKAETSAVPMQVLFRPEARDKRNKLLSALKPYLSPARCAMIDRAMSAMQLGELLGTMGGPGMGNMGQGEG